MANIASNPLRNQQLRNKNLEKISGISFTPRQIDVLACLIHKRNYSKIAELLKIESTRTVQTHIRDIRAKLGGIAVEDIIDFIEKSGKRKYLVEYYFNITIESCFKKKLQKLRKLIIKNNQIHYLQQGSTDTSKHLLLLIQKIANHLHLVGITPVKSKNSLNSGFILYLIGNNSDLHPDRLLNHKKDELQYIYLLFDKSEKTIFPTDIKNHVDFSNNNYYSALFSLLKLISENKSAVEVVESEFNEEYRALQDSWDGTIKGNPEPGDSTGRTPWYKSVYFLSLLAFTVILSLMLYWKIYDKNEVTMIQKADNSNQHSNLNVDDLSKLFKSLDRKEQKSKFTNNSFFYENEVPFYIDRFYQGKNIFDKFDDILKNHKFLLITGPGGSGKSSIVIQYAHNLVLKGKEVIFCNSDSTDKLQQLYMNMAASMDIGAYKENKNITINLVNAELDKIDKELIFIFDHSKNYDGISEYIKKLPKSAKYIITSRDARIIENIEDSIQHIDLQPHFSLEEAKIYLSKALNGVNYQNNYNNEIRLTDQEIEQLLSTVSLSPIKMSHVVSWFLKKENRLKSVADYLELYKSLHLFDDPELKLLLQELHGNSLNILQYIAYLDPDYICLDILKHILALHDLSILQSDINNLEAQSLIKLVRKKDTGKFGIKIHRNVQKDIIDFTDKYKNLNLKLEIASKELIYKELVIALNKLMPKITWQKNEEWQKSKLIYPHAEKFIKTIDRESAYQDVFSQDRLLLIQIAELIHKMGLYNHHLSCDREKAIKYYEKAKNIYLDANNAKGQADVLLDQGWCYFDMRRQLQKSEESFAEVLKLADTDNLLKARSLSGLAVVYDKNYDGTKPDSLATHEQALDMYMRAYSGRDHADIARALHNTAWYYREKGHRDGNKDYIKKSVEIFNKSLSMRERLYGKNSNHPDVASSISGKATSYAYLGGKENLDEALKLHKKVLEMREKVFANYPSQYLISSYFRLGETYRGLKDYGKALEFFGKARDISYDIQKTYIHDPITGVFQKMGEVHEAAGHKGEAEECYKKAYSVIKLGNYNKNRPENQILAKHLKRYDPGFMDDNNTESRIFITNHGKLGLEAYNIKSRIKSKILDSVYNLAKDGQWHNGWLSYGVKSYIEDGYIRKVLGNGTNSQEIEIAKQLCFEAINLGIMSQPEQERDFSCLKEFTKQYKGVVEKIIREHPEYFVDGSILIELAKDNPMIDENIICSVIDQNQLLNMDIANITKNDNFKNKNCNDIMQLILKDN